MSTADVLQVVGDQPRVHHQVGPTGVQLVPVAIADQTGRRHGPGKAAEIQTSGTLRSILWNSVQIVAKVLEAVRK